MRIHVVSFGGVCCTHIIKQMQSVGIVTNDAGNKDGLKHQYSPTCPKLQKLQTKYEKIIYLYNDPMLALISHFGRKWAHDQHRKIIRKATLTRKHLLEFKILESHTVKAGKDVFGLEEHFNEWFHFEHKKPIVFLDVREEDFNERLNAFVGADVPLHFGTRGSKKESCSEEMLRIYEALDDRIKEKIASLRTD